MAASGPLPVPAPPARPHSARRMRRAWRGARPGAVGRAAVAIHVALRARGQRCVESVRRHGSHDDLADQLGRGLGDHGARGHAGATAHGAEGRAADRGRREGGGQGPSFPDAGLRLGGGHGGAHRRRPEDGEPERRRHGALQGPACRHRGGGDGHVGARSQRAPRPCSRCRRENGLRPLPRYGLCGQGGGDGAHAGAS